jgi:dCMP deaminase
VALRNEFDNLKSNDSIKNLFKDNPKSITFSDDAYKIVIDSNKINDFSAKLKEIFKDLIISESGSPFQYFGDNIRKTGKPFDGDSEGNLSNAYIIANLIKQLIKQLRGSGKKELRIVIDSIRNSFEARYFRERYSAFYLFAVNTKDKFRIERLSTYFSRNQILNLDIEYLKDLKTKETFYKQDIKSCIQMSDIYLYNPNDDESVLGEKFYTLKKSIVRYLSLIYHPGIITPTPEERTMQVAYTAKYNSGCISRQVGAVVTDKDFSIKSIGWNNTPQGQTPCLLRNAKDLVNNTDNISFSEYEKSTTSDIKKYVSEGLINNTSILKGLNPCFCFKQIQNVIDGEKNQVHTRSLHAEENAMLQIAKYGGEGLSNGNLFTTASPCELCSKKAYQLGIKNIYYIDPYPGIAESQILNTGDNIPKLNLFNGAVGKAYHSVFEPFMPYKDELEVELDIDFKQHKSKINSQKPQEFKQKRIQELEKIINKAKEEKDKL